MDKAERNEDQLGDEHRVQPGADRVVEEERHARNEGQREGAVHQDQQRPAHRLQRDAGKRSQPDHLKQQQQAQKPGHAKEMQKPRHPVDRAQPVDPEAQIGRRQPDQKARRKVHPPIAVNVGHPRSMAFPT
ncbi:MAG TPA: hypothetical protein VFW46_03400 [Stellaceae bacterium]|nr:hypothetical protein [Stellaceae bacterium]